MSAMWGIAAHSVLDVGYKLVSGVLSNVPLVEGPTYNPRATAPGVNVAAIAPTVIHAGIQNESVELIGRIFSKYWESELGCSIFGLEFQSH